LKPRENTTDENKTRLGGETQKKYLNKRLRRRVKKGEQPEKPRREVLSGTMPTRPKEKAAAW